jgi:hypothetical protein
MELNRKIIEKELIAIERDACLNSFYEFFLSFWDIVVPEELKDNWHIKYICNELQAIVPYLKERKKKPYDLIFNVPPGSTKTTIVLQMFPAWLWAVDPTLRIISSSHSASLSIDSASKSRDILLSPRYRLLFPHVKLRDDKSAKTSYENTKGGTRDVTSTGSSITGRHAHVKLMDDLQDIAKAASEPDREQAISHMKTLFTREVEKGNSINVLIMQRLHELDCTAYLKGLSVKRKVRHICLPATLSPLVSPPEVAAFYKDGLLDPIRMSPAILEEKRTELGTYGYTSQFDQEPTPPEGGIVKRHWFKIMPRELCMASTGVFNFFIDTAYEEKKFSTNGSDAKKYITGEAKNDPTGLLATVTFQGVCYIWDYREVYLEINDLVRFIQTWALNTGYTSASRVMIEPKASGKSTVQTLRQFTNLNVSEITGGKDSKLTELMNAVPAIESGRFTLILGEWNRLFLDRVCGFPNAAHDEAVDLLCYAKKYYFGASNVKAADDAYQKALQFFN